VAITCLPQAASDSQGNAQALAQQQPPLSPNLTWQELQGHSGSPNSSPEQKKNRLLGSAFGAAANVLKAIGNPAKGECSSSMKQLRLLLHCLITSSRLVMTGGEQIGSLHSQLIVTTSALLDVLSLVNKSSKTSLAMQLYHSNKHGISLFIHNTLRELQNSMLNGALLALEQIVYE